jgi:Domain of unknown function (DUF4249)
MKLSIKLNSIIIAFFSILFIGCNPDNLAPVVQIELPPSPKLLVPNMYMQYGIGTSMFVGQTQEVLSQNPNYFVDNASIELYQNGVLVNQVWQKQNQVYTLPNFTPTPGNVYATKIKVDGFPIAEAIDTMPNLMNFTITKTGKVKYYEDKGSDFNNPQSYQDTLIQVLFTFEDDGNTKDFYRILLLDNDSTGHHISPNVYSQQSQRSEVHCIDPVFQSSGNPLGDFGNTADDIVFLADNYFTDNSFNGTKKTITFYIPVGYGNYATGKPGFDKGYFYLQHLSRSAYLHVNALKNYEDQGGFFSQPSLIFTNYKNGLGILGCQSTRMQELQIK